MALYLIGLCEPRALPGINGREPVVFYRRQLWKMVRKRPVILIKDECSR